MPGECIVIDGLWRCLCPSLDAITLSRALQKPTTPLRRPRHLHLPCRRRYTTSAPAMARSPSFSQYMHRAWKRNRELPRTLFRGAHNFDDAMLDSIGTQTMLDTLRELQTLEQQYHSIAKIVHYLITKRREKPTAFLYECIIRANTDYKHGSAQIVADLLKEMETTGVLPTAGVYNAILDVLAIHPDYVLRNKVLKDMRQAWLTPTFNAHVSVAIGLLRDGQYEMALEKLEEMYQSGVPIPIWAYDTFIYTFGELGFSEEALMIMQHRLRDPEASDTGENLWLVLLDSFSRDSFYEGVHYIWTRMVGPGKLTPSDGVVLNVLNIASRNGDVVMASSALKIFSMRGRKLDLHHFEPLLEIHAGQGDLRKAFITLCLIDKAGLQPDLSSTRVIYRLLRESPSEIEPALFCLRNLQLEHRVPVAAFNVVLEAALQQHGFKHGLDVYRSVRRICTAGPDTTTFNLLLSHCSVYKSLKFVMAEMQTLSIKMNQSTYDHAIRVCFLQKLRDHAFSYLEQMQNDPAAESGGWWLNKGTALAFIRGCIFAEDARVQILLDGCKKRGLDVDEEVRVLIA
ncbi:uncharacterized protein BCR38DRAFT_314822, partial [Pseudomassariella vexata]